MTLRTRPGSGPPAPRSTPCGWWRLHAWANAAWLGALLLAAGHAESQSLRDLSDLSLEELSQVEITSVSKRPEPLSQAPAAVYVITNDDIRRSGATTLPEALRLAPNLEVARVDAQTYNISSRGMNSSRPPSSSMSSRNKIVVLAINLLKTVSCFGSAAFLFQSPNTKGRRPNQGFGASIL